LLESLRHGLIEADAREKDVIEAMMGEMTATKTYPLLPALRDDEGYLRVKLAAHMWSILRQRWDNVVGLPQFLGAVRAGDGQHRHASRFACLDTSRCVLNDKAGGRDHAEQPCRFQVALRRGLSFGYAIAVHEDRRLGKAVRFESREHCPALTACHDAPGRHEHGVREGRSLRERREPVGYVIQQRIENDVLIFRRQVWSDLGDGIDWAASVRRGPGALKVNFTQRTPAGPDLAIHGEGVEQDPIKIEQHRP